MGTIFFANAGTHAGAADDEFELDIRITEVAIVSTANSDQGEDDGAWTSGDTCYNTCPLSCGTRSCGRPC